MKRATLNVHIRVNHPTTRQPTPARLLIRTPQGDPGAGAEFFAPLGRFADFALSRNESVGGQVLLGKSKYFYIDGACEVPLPAGVPLEFVVYAGPGFRTIRDILTLTAGQISLRFTLEAVPLPLGWFCGDTRTHFATPHDTLLEARAEGLHVSHLLITHAEVPGQDGMLHPASSHLSAFSGQQACIESGGSAVAVNTFNSHPVLGKVALLNCHRAVFPLTFGDIEDSDDWSIADWCDQCHRKNGLAIWVDAFAAKGGTGGISEAFADLLLGKIDALEIADGIGATSRIPLWYRLLNLGLRTPLVGASGKDSNRVAAGSMRTWAHTGGATFSLGDWIEAVRSGATSISNGPVLLLRVDDALPGTAIHAAEGQPLRVRIEGYGEETPDTLELIVNGVARAAVMGEGEIEMPDGGWVAARWRSTSPAIDGRSAYAHTSPVYVEVAGRPAYRSATGSELFRRMLEATVEWIETHGRFERERRKQQLLEIVAKAQDVLEERLRG